jgi:hypothetical protein
MARKVIIFTATMGRDAGQKFQITEMSARAGHQWATRAILALMSSGADIPDDLESGGMAALAVVGMKAIGKLPAEVASPLLDELLDCVQIVMEKATRAWQDDDFQEIATLFQLQKAVFSLHIEPFISGGPSTSALATAAPAV